MYGDKIYRTTLDANVIALDIKTGKEVWRSNAIDFKTGYSMTMPPLVANGVVVTGVSGGEFGIRGFIDGWDAETGKQLWRRYTVPGSGEKGNETWVDDQWKQGGGAAWLIGSYDPQLDLMYWGVGNPSSWNVQRRKGDNLYTGWESRLLEGGGSADRQGEMASTVRHATLGGNIDDGGRRGIHREFIRRVPGVRCEPQLPTRAAPLSP